MILRCLSALAALFVAGPGLACSGSTPCNVEGGEYFILLPEAGDTPPPALFYIHGFGASGEGVFRNTGMVNAFLERGYAVIAPNGMERGNGNGRSWSFHPQLPQRRDELPFLTRVRDDAIERHGLDGDRILMAGFSIGGSMTAYLACAAPETFAAYAPVGGNFWRPHPTECAGPVKMLHTHGWTDGTVPLEGRVLRGADADAPDALIQGDIFHALSIWRETNGCRQLKADSFVTEGPFLRRKWERCDAGTALEFALFPGGHAVPRGWATMAMDWFEGL